MSTKIYDAYKLKNLSAFEVGNFIKELKGKLLEVSAKSYSELFAQEVIELIDNLCIYDAEKNFGAVDKLLRRIYLDSEPVKNLLDTKINIDDLNIEKVKKSLLIKILPIKTIVNDILSQKTKLSEISGSYRYYEYNFINKIVFFPMKEKLLFIVFGNKLRHLMADLCFLEDNDSVAFRKSYGLEDYHYQDQTDRPDGISKEDWKQREADWDKAMPSWIPANDGIVIEMLNSERLFDELFFSVDNKNLLSINSFISSKEERADKRAYESVKDKYVKDILNKENKNDDVARYMEVSQEFREKVKKGNIEVLFEIEKEKEKLSKILYDFSDEEKWNKSIISYIPNYMEGE